MKKVSRIIFINIIILFLLLIILELSLIIYSKINNINFINDNRTSNLFRVYEEGEIFKNYKNFYTYKENLKNKRYLNFYKLEKEIIKVWDYKFSTNNFGLVQKFDLDTQIKSILFLGDSFTEGQGAKPWLENLGRSFRGYQVVNGGFGGTGPIQFKNLNNYLSNKINIEYRIVILIPSDIRRGIVKLNNTNCIKNYFECNKNNNVFSIPKNNNFNIEEHLSKFVFNKKIDTKKNIKFFIRDLYLYQYLRKYINLFRLKNDKNIKYNLNSLLELEKKYKDKIVFIQIKDASEIMFKKASYETELINKFFSKNDIRKHNCDMNNDLSLFHKYDFHPNKNGYTVLRNCVTEILNNFIK